MQISAERDGKFVVWDWRASLVPTAAVIPAPGAHIFVAAVKRSVVSPVWTVSKARCSRLRVSTVAGEIGTVDGDWIRQREVKIVDLPRTVRSGGDCQGCIR